jgi:8-oxo-dGTP pyrophosphatase MutT (NUDIX family)
VNDRNQLLILKHASGSWLLPGGRLNAGETWKEGLVREIEEETSILDFELCKIVEVDNWVYNEIPHFGVFYSGKISGKADVLLSPEHCDYKWINSLDDLEGLVFWHEGLKKRVVAFLRSTFND